MEIDSMQDLRRMPMSALGARRVRRVLPALAGLMFCIAAGPAEGQSNLDAGKSPEQIFSDTCSACHHGPHGLKQTSAQFLRQHYTTGARQAAAMAAYLEKAATEP